MKQHSELLSLSSKLGFEPKKVDGTITFAGKPALGVCGINGLLYTSEKSLVHEFVHVLQHHELCWALRTDNGDWCINELPRFASMSFCEVRDWVKSVLPALSSIYSTGQLPVEIPALFAEAFYTDEEFLNGLIFLANFALENDL